MQLTLQLFSEGSYVTLLTDTIFIGRIALKKSEHKAQTELFQLDKSVRLRVVDVRESRNSDDIEYSLYMRDQNNIERSFWVHERQLQPA